MRARCPVDDYAVSGVAEATGRRESVGWTEGAPLRDNLVMVRDALLPIAARGQSISAADLTRILSDVLRDSAKPGRQ